MEKVLSKIFGAKSLPTPAGNSANSISSVGSASGSNLPAGNVSEPSESFTMFIGLQVKMM